MDYIWAFNKRRGMKRRFPIGVWDRIKTNPNLEYVEIGDTEPIEIPEEIEVVKKKDALNAEDHVIDAGDHGVRIKAEKEMDKVPTMSELRTELKKLKVEIPKHATRIQLQKLYNDNRK